MDLTIGHLRRYLSRCADGPVEIQAVRDLGGSTTVAAALKGFGYGHPLLVQYQCGEQVRQVVFHRIRANSFGRERSDDRAAAVWLDFHTFNELPQHVPALDMVMHTRDGQIRSVAGAQELLLVTNYRPGRLHADDLVRIRDEGICTTTDIARAESLAAYLAKIHGVKRDHPVLWRRRLRDLVGHGEGIMGLTDSYRCQSAPAGEQLLLSIEERANRWRWRLKPLSHRLSQVHGDFHPFNVIFEDDLSFYVLDRSRGAWGDPADDLSCMTINYIFFSIQRCGRLGEPFLGLHHRFWECYLSMQADQELSGAIQPWFAWRALVLASPTWYPDIAPTTRQVMLTFADRILDSERYDYRRVNSYLEPA